MLTEKCAEWFEQLEATHKSHQMSAQSREVTDRKQSERVTTCIEDSDGNIIMEQEEILAIWYEYISEPYNDNRRDIPEMSTNNDLTLITRTEVKFVLKGIRMNKGP